MKYASFWDRFVALFIDLAVIVLFSMAIISLLVFVLKVAGIGTEIMGNSSEQKINWIVGVCVFLYYAVLESSKFQGTFGKVILKIRVSDYEGNRISFLRASARNLGKIISMQILLLGFIMAAFTKRKQGLHDMMAKSLVIKA